MNTKRCILLGLVMLVVVGTRAQSATKFGYLNTAELLQAMPEVQSADKQLSAFKEGLDKGGESKVKAFQDDYKQYVDDVNSGVLSKVQQADREATLSKEQQAINDYQQQVQDQVEQKRQELLKPILQKIDEAVKAEGKEGGYTFIFDSSVSGALLYAVEGDDLMDAIKHRLGLQ